MRAPALTVRVLRGIGQALTALEYEHQAGADGQYSRQEAEDLQLANAWWREQVERRGWERVFPSLKQKQTGAAGFVSALADATRGELTVTIDEGGRVHWSPPKEKP